MIEVVKAGAQSAYSLSLREAHAHDLVDVRLRGSHIGRYTCAIEAGAWRRPRGERMRGGLHPIGGGGNGETVSQGSLCRRGHRGLCAERARGYAGAVGLAGGWRDGGGRGFDLSMEVIRLEDYCGGELNVP